MTTKRRPQGNHPRSERGQQTRSERRQRTRGGPLAGTTSPRTTPTTQRPPVISPRDGGEYRRSLPPPRKSEYQPRGQLHPRGEYRRSLPRRGGGGYLPPRDETLGQTPSSVRGAEGPEKPIPNWAQIAGDPQAASEVVKAAEKRRIGGQTAYDLAWRDSPWDAALPPEQIQERLEVQAENFIQDGAWEAYAYELYEEDDGQGGVVEKPDTSQPRPEFEGLTEDGMKELASKQFLHETYATQIVPDMVEAQSQYDSDIRTQAGTRYMMSQAEPWAQRAEGEAGIRADQIIAQAYMADNEIDYNSLMREAEMVRSDGQASANWIRSQAMRAPTATRDRDMMEEWIAAWANQDASNRRVLSQEDEGGGGGGGFDPDAEAAFGAQAPIPQGAYSGAGYSPSQSEAIGSTLYEPTMNYQGMELTPSDAEFMLSSGIYDVMNGGQQPWLPYPQANSQGGFPNSYYPGY
jgi:hypothetical protein